MSNNLKFDAVYERVLKQYTLPETKKAIFTFGRFNPPTAGHELLIKTIRQYGIDHDSYIFVSQTHDNKKNPLTWKDKFYFLNNIFPNDNFVKVPEIKTIFDAAYYLRDKGYEDVILIVGEDRLQQFKNRFEQYTNHPDPNKALKFVSFNVISSGIRDPDASDVSGASGTKAREYASQNNFEKFKSILPQATPIKISKELFEKIQQGLAS